MLPLCRSRCSRDHALDRDPEKALPRALGIVLLLALAAAPASAQCLANPIVCENQLPGTSDWRIDGPISGDVDAEIQGYGSATSVDLGGTLDLHVTVEGGDDWTLEIFRMGFYGGDGGRSMLAAGPFPGIDQGPCAVLAANPASPAQPDPNASVECQWSVGYSLVVPTSWTSGLYLVKLEASDGYQAYVPFVVRDDAREADFLYVQAVMAYQAYNQYPAGTAQSLSFYTGGTASRPWLKRLSFDRPYGSANFLRNNESPFSNNADGSGGFFTWDFPMILWLEEQGYDVVYATNVDLHADPGRLLEVRGMLSVGHDEYWTDEMATAAANARDAGTNLGFFAGNHVFGTVALQPATVGGAANRMMEGLTKGLGPDVGPGAGDPDDIVDKIKRQALFGQAHTGCCVRKPIVYYDLPWIVSEADHWVFEGTGFQNGDAVRGLLGYEPDAFEPGWPAPANLHFTLLSDSPFTPTAAGAPGGDPSPEDWLRPWPLASAQSTIHQAPSGAWVFSAGTTDWPWGLATPFAAGPPPYDPASGDGLPTSQGYSANLTLAGSGQLVEDGGLPAWRANGSGGLATWVRVPEGSEAQGLVDGYEHTSVLRLESGGFVASYYASGGRRFLPILGLAGGDLEVALEGGGTFVLASGAAATDYHTHRVVYDGTTGLATYSFDGVDVATWAGATTTQNGFFFGQGSSSTPGVALYRSVGFGPTTPLAPDPRIQTMTANLLARLASVYDPAAPIAYDAAIGDGLPARQGFTNSLTNGGAGSWIANDFGAPAWHADGTAGRATWDVIPSPATKALAATQGWRIESVLRVVAGDYVTDYYADGSRRFLPILSLVAGELRVQLEGGGAHVLATGPAATDYHTHEVRFDPATGLATYSFDGTPIETWAGSATTQSQITFGQGSTSIAGEAYYRGMRFELLPVAVPGLAPGAALGALSTGIAAASSILARRRRALRDRHAARTG